MSKVKGKSKKSSSGKSSGGRVAFRGGLSEMMKRAHRIQTKLEELKEEMKDETWTADAAGGKIKATISGEKELTSIEIDKELVNPEDIETLQDAVVSAVNAAIKLADEKLNAATEEVTQGMKIPGLF
ncbi:MAG: YbaB/EbfC family nucleoid-associated protein [Deltaproteobacteria bacterium]|nr:YbaB/EbfC family nucleoid-associated protein [Deltaproteobacteria bacterium]MBN2671022.1 YbaB/EbfC family nucleoid-associated protein [Deltaproteobacteria bacterium]